jgi:glycosyltransferase involved in cell wall biosynthesis
MHEVLDAARQLPDVQFLITGDVRKCPPDLRSALPPNVELTGWADETFRLLVERSHMMLVLTTDMTSVPRAAFEAIEARRPLLLTDRPDLQLLFPAAISVSNSGAGIAAGVRDAIERHVELVGLASSARVAQRAHWDEQLQRLLALLSEDGPSDAPQGTPAFE